MELRKLLIPVVCAAMPAAAADQEFDHSLKFPMQNYAGHFREHCMELQAGQALHLAVSTSHPVQLNVHHHGESGTVFLLDEVVADSRSRTVRVPDHGDYCLEVRNPDNRPSGFDLRLHYRISAD